MWLSYLNWVDAQIAVIEGDTDASEDLVAANLAQRQTYKVWRTDGLHDVVTDAGFSVDFGAVREIGCLALIFPRVNDPGVYDDVPDFAATDTVRHRLDADTPGAGALYDSGVIVSGVLPGYGVHFVKLSAPVEARYWRCDLDAISRGVEGYLDVARAWAGPVLEPAVGISYGAQRVWASDSVVARASRGISDFVDSVPSLRSWSFTLDWLQEDNAEPDALDEFERRVTSAAQFLACRPDLPVGKNAMLARQQQSSGIESARFRLDKKSFRLIESL